MPNGSLQVSIDCILLIYHLISLTAGRQAAIQNCHPPQQTSGAAGINYPPCPEHTSEAAPPRPQHVIRTPECLGGAPGRAAVLNSAHGPPPSNVRSGQRHAFGAAGNHVAPGGSHKAGRKPAPLPPQPTRAGRDQSASSDSPPLAPLEPDAARAWRAEEACTQDGGACRTTDAPCWRSVRARRFPQALAPLRLRHPYSSTARSDTRLQ